MATVQIGEGAVARALALVGIICLALGILALVRSRQPRDVVRLRVGARHAVPAAGVSVLIDGDVYDSRCPAHRRCASPGLVSVRLDVFEGDQRLNGLRLAADPRRPWLAHQTFYGHTYTLVRVDPDPPPTDRLPPDAYAITLRVN